MRLACRAVFAVSIFAVGFVMPARPAQRGGAPAKSPGPSYTIGILTFQDASGGDYGESLAKVLHRQLQAAILNASRHTPRFLKQAEGSEEAEQTDVDSAVKLAKSQKTDFALMGSLLSVQVNEGEGGLNAPMIGGVTAGGHARSQEAEVVLQVDLIDVGRGERTASLRATGKDRDTKIAADVYTDYGSMDMGGATFQNTVLGKATQKAIDQVVKQVLSRLQASTASSETDTAGKSPAAARPASENAARPAATVTPPQSSGASAQAAAEVYGNRFDFVPGSKTLVCDDFSETDVGEYPAKWTVKEGGGNTAEVVQRDGRKFFQSRFMADGAGASMHWLRYEIKGDLSKNFTIEFDADVQGPFSLVFSDEYNNGGQEISFEPDKVKSRNVENPTNLGSGVKHVSMNISDTSVKAYVGGERVLNDPDAIERPIKRIGFRFDSTAGEPNKGQMFTAFRLAEGGKDFKSMLAGSGRIVTHGILFDTGSDVLKPESGPELRNILQLLQGDPKLRFAIEGHTDNQGGPNINGPLSERRAAAVKTWLVQQGIDASRLTSKGFGDSKPIDTNATAEGRANNRRVEFARIQP
ncbi:MAG TPA: OmpA family protein [Acidobacteriota bacterium]|nr:OmpA family protein [Acidobacteriota bacterium]